MLAFSACSLPTVRPLPCPVLRGLSSGDCIRGSPAPGFQLGSANGSNWNELRGQEDRKAEGFIVPSPSASACVVPASKTAPRGPRLLASASFHFASGLAWVGNRSDGL